MAGIQMSTTIAASLDRVFAVFSDLPHAAERIRGIKRLEILTPGPIRAGTRWRETRVLFGKEATEEMTLTSFQPNRGYTAEAESSGMKYTVSFRFTSEGQNTRVDVDFNATPVSLMARLAGPLTGMMMNSVRKVMEEDLEDLKKTIESDQKPAG